MARRQGNDTNRRIAKVADVSVADVEKILASSRHSSSGHHKKHPEAHGLQPGPRGNKSFCDDIRVISLNEAKDLLSRGVRRRMASEHRMECFPKYVWAVDDRGEAFEANLGGDSYHGIVSMTMTGKYASGSKRNGMNEMTDFRVMLSPDEIPGDPAEEAPEECATLRVLVVEAGGFCLSSGYDNLTKTHRDGPIVAAYYFAEWLLQNWWRLRYDPRPSGPISHYWELSHNFTGVGEGYVWPNVTISSDGHRSSIWPKPSRNKHLRSFAYHGTPYPIILPWSSVESGIDNFVKDIMDLTAKKDLRDTNLDRLWSDISAEREDPDLGRFRRFEALLGADPDHLPEETVEKHLSDAADLGEDAVDELAAATAGRGIGYMLTAMEVREISKKHGVEMRVADAPASKDIDIPVTPGYAPAAEVGVSAARKARRVFVGNHDKIDDRLLAEIAGVSEKIFKSSDPKSSIPFTLSNGDGGGHAVLRSTRRQSQRFDLARLVGDALIWEKSQMRPSTRAKTYRQKAQRAFAAEFLAPIEHVVAQADDDYSDEKKEDIARHFKVSPMVIDGLLKHNHYIERDDFDFA